MYHHILIPTDGTGLSLEAIHQGIDLAALHGARATLLHCSPPFVEFSRHALLTIDRKQYESLASSAARRVLAVGEDYAKEKGVPAGAEHLFAEHPHEAIVDTAESLGCDLIVMASHGRKARGPFTLGSQTLKVLAHTKRPVLVCREPQPQGRPM